MGEGQETVGDCEVDRVTDWQSQRLDKGSFDSAAARLRSGLRKFWLHIELWTGYFGVSRRLRPEWWNRHQPYGHLSTSTILVKP